MLGNKLGKTAKSGADGQVGEKSIYSFLNKCWKSIEFSTFFAKKKLVKLGWSAHKNGKNSGILPIESADALC